jgi:hypothetical protein
VKLLVDEKILACKINVSKRFGNLFAKSFDVNSGALVFRAMTSQTLDLIKPLSLQSFNPSFDHQVSSFTQSCCGGRCPEEIEASQTVSVLVCALIRC